MLKIFPEIILKATTTNKPVGAFRLWFLAKGFDRGGSGNIPAKKFRRFVIGLGVTRPTLYRWLEQARTLNLIKQRGDFYRLSAWHTGAQIAGVQKLQGAVLVNTERFVSKGWLGLVWSAFLVRYPNPVSRQTLEQRSGVPERTQRHYEQMANTPKTANYADLGSDPDVAMAVCDRPGHYPTRGRWARRLPNTYHPEGVTPANKGRTRKINAELRNCNHEGSIPPQRLYCVTGDQVKTAQRQNRKGDAKTRPDLFYVLIKAVATKTQVWQVVTF